MVTPKERARKQSLLKAKEELVPRKPSLVGPAPASAVLAAVTGGSAVTAAAAVSDAANKDTLKTKPASEMNKREKVFAEIVSTDL